jgi:hypothetical protein
MALRAAVMGLEGAPRIGPVPSATSHIEWASRASERLGLEPYPWQSYVLNESLACKSDGTLKYREIAAIVARQNGKTEILRPRIVAGLDAGRRILHTAQNRIIPRNTLLSIARLDPSRYKVREANGQESILDRETGGWYKIIAPQRGARGESADDLIIDEVREYEDWSFISAAEPTVSASEDPQVIYLSNAGSELSVVLNDLRARGMAGAEGLCYMEWSADPELATDDPVGWMQANPSLGYGHLTMERLQALYEKYRDAGELAIWETEHLCRWVASMLPRLIMDVTWQQARSTIEPPRLPALGISVDPSGKRASAVLAWPQLDGSVAVMEAADVTGDPINLTALAAELEQRMKAWNVIGVAYDPWTDQHLARHFPEISKSITGQEFANATERFVRQVETGQLHWQVADSISSDLPYAARKPTVGTAFMAERAKGDRSITAVLAAIRAVWVASAPLQRAVLY